MPDKTTDEAVMELLKKVAQKKDEIKALKKRPHWKTNCSFGFNPEDSHGRVNIQIIKDTKKIINIYAFLNRHLKDTVEAALALGLEGEFDSTWQGYSITDWQDDLQQRADQLSLETKQREVDELDERVNKLVSPEQRREMELAALQELLDD